MIIDHFTRGFNLYLYSFLKIFISETISTPRKYKILWINKNGDSLLKTFSTLIPIDSIFHDAIGTSLIFSQLLNKNWILCFSLIDGSSLLQSFIYRSIAKAGLNHYMEAGQGQSFEEQRKFVETLMRSEEYRGGRGVEQINSLIEHRIKKFYVNDDYIEVDTEHFKPRIEPLYLPGVVPTDDTLLLFGIDFMSKQQLKAYFNQFAPQYYFLDQSNCIIKFASPETARQAIIINLRPDSYTRFKVEQDAEEAAEVGLQFSLPKSQPKEWIELRPYTYSFKKTKFSAKDYERKLYVRYATNKEMQIGFDRTSFYDELINRCRLIWEKEAKKDEEVRKFLEGKMKSYRETISKYGKRSENSHPHSQRSRSRDRLKTPPTNQETTSRRTEQVDQSLNMQIHSRSQNSEDMRNLMNEFQQLNMESGVSFSQSDAMTKEKKVNLTGMSGAPLVGYKVAQPEQLRVEFKHAHFDYKKYVQESMRREEKKKRVAVVDLTDD